MREYAGVVTFRIGDLGFWIEINKAQTKDLFLIPQSAFLKSAIELLQYSNTPQQLAIFTGKTFYL
jgi:hypothetical protein